MDRVFLLHHTIKRGDEEDDKIIGIYSSMESAERAIARLREKPGFRDPRGEFVIGPYNLDQDYWAEGFGVE
jgi:hypothetical protein